MPARRRELIDGAGERAWATLTSYVRGTVVIALVEGLLIGAAMFIMQVPLALSLTLVVFVGAFIPFVGATVSGVLAILITLVTVGPISAVALLTVVLLVQFLDGNLLQPFVMGHLVQLHPIVILVGVSVGAILGGIVGAILAVPLVGITYRVTEYLTGHTGTRAAEA